ncbi:MAG: hypothetical protein LCH70_15755, partial [Proteobacteria bacterium]|nr:hypothetical protein [Pseudomonadota bacterium]
MRGFISFDKRQKKRTKEKRFPDTANQPSEFLRDFPTCPPWLGRKTAGIHARRPTGLQIDWQLQSMKKRTDLIAFHLGNIFHWKPRRAAHRDVRRFPPRQGCRGEKSQRRYNSRVCLIGEGPFLWFVSFWPEKEMNPRAAGGRKLLPFAGKQSRGLAGLPLLRSTSPRWQAWSLRGQKPSAIHPGERTM